MKKYVMGFDEFLNESHSEESETESTILDFMQTDLCKVIEDVPVGGKVWCDFYPYFEKDDTLVKNFHTETYYMKNYNNQNQEVLLFQKYSPIYKEDATIQTYLVKYRIFKDWKEYREKAT